jgi:hypothetical protein
MAGQRGSRVDYRTVVPIDTLGRCVIGVSVPAGSHVVPCLLSTVESGVGSAPAHQLALGGPT